MSHSVVKVKICGITSPDDARCAVWAGADAIGFVFAESSRRVSSQEAAHIGSVVPPFVAKVGVFVDESVANITRIVQEARLDVVQLHGQEDDEFINELKRLGCKVVKAVAVRDESVVEQLPFIGADALLLDKYDPKRAGGTGETFDWRLAAAARRHLQKSGRDVPVILAGGLHPANVQAALDAVKPYAVDVSSGVEKAPGRKCRDKMRRFVLKVRQWHGNDKRIRRLGYRSLW